MFMILMFVLAAVGFKLLIVGYNYVHKKAVWYLLMHDIKSAPLRLEQQPLEHE